MISYITLRNKFLMAAIVITGFWSNAGVASCGTWTAVTGTVDFGTSSLQRDAPIGSIIKSWIPAAELPSASGDCLVGGTMTYMGGISSGMTSAEGFPIYKTNLAGVGIVGAINVGQVLKQVPFTNPQTTNTYPGGFQNKSPTYFELIKIGDITPGTLQGGELAKGYYDSQLAGTITLVGGVINQLACSVNTPVVNVVLGNYLVSDFTSIGDTTESIKVPVTLNCNTGARINVIVSAEEDNDAVNTIQLIPGGATGVAVQLLDDSGNQVPINQKFVSNTITTNGQFIFNWKARYIKTKATITPGGGDAHATLQLTYE